MHAARGAALCHARADTYGEYYFKDIPSGTYTLIANFKRAFTIYDVSTTEMTVTVPQG